jgi:CheY-like chemotaxis protein
MDSIVAGGLSARPLAGAGVLVVEDEPNVRRSLEEVLRELGCRVIGPVGSVHDALALLCRDRPDLVLLDMSLSDGQADPVAEALAALDVPFALMTGSGRTRLDEPCLRDAPCLAKPFGLAELEHMLRSLAGRSMMPAAE